MCIHTVHIEKQVTSALVQFSPVAVASRLTFDLGVTADGSTSGSGSAPLSVPVPWSACTGDGAGTGTSSLGCNQHSRKVFIRFK